jgi:hypothetical protein
VFFYGKDQVLLVILEKSTKFWMSKSWEKKKPSCGLQGREFRNDVVFIWSSILMNARQGLTFLLD